MSDSFKIEDNYKEKKKMKKGKNKNNNIILFISIALLAIVCIVLLVVLYKNFKSKINVQKLNIEKPYVYTIEKIENEYDEGSYDEIPTINLVGSQYSKLNETIKNNYVSVSEQKNYVYSYKFKKSNTILSLLIAYSFYVNDEPKTYFETIIIDLNKDRILSKSDILKRYGLNEKQINTFLESKFKNIYTDIIKNGYYTSKECDYNCFLNNRKISSNYVDGLAYFIDEDSLLGYKYFNFESKYGEEDYFIEKDYVFVIKK